MRRVWLVILSALLLAGIGCGKKNYENRVEASINKLRDLKRLNDNLMKEPTEKKFRDLSIYVRPPKEETQTQTGQLPVNEGQFDLDASFNDKTDSTLHVLARVKMPKKAPAKGAPAPPPPPQPGEFVSEVLGSLSSIFGAPEGLQTPKWSEESKKSGNRFKRLIFTAGEKEVKVYTFKDGNHEVALIFVYDPKLKGPISTKIDLCLESFAVGSKAGKLYAGTSTEEEADPNAGAPR